MATGCMQPVMNLETEAAPGTPERQMFSGHSSTRARTWLCTSLWTGWHGWTVHSQLKTNTTGPAVDRREVIQRSLVHSGRFTLVYQVWTFFDQTYALLSSPTVHGLHFPILDLDWFVDRRADCIWRWWVVSLVGSLFSLNEWMDKKN